MGKNFTEERKFVYEALDDTYQSGILAFLSKSEECAGLGADPFPIGGGPFPLVCSGSGSAGGGSSRPRPPRPAPCMAAHIVIPIWCKAASAVFSAEISAHASAEESEEDE